MTAPSTSSGRNRRDIAKQLMAGGIAGAVSRTVVSPLERMKILFQVQGAGKARYEGVLPTLAKVYREEGVVGYFKGNGTNCIRIAPYSAVQFATYEQLKRSLMSPGATELSTPQRLTAGALAGIASVMSTYPLDIARTRLSVLSDGKQVGDRRLSIFNVMSYIYRHENGVRGLYRGIIPTLMGVAPYVAFNFTVYETMRSRLTPPATIDNPNPQPSVGARLFCGGVAGTVAQTLTYPLDLIRRRFQVMEMKGFGYHYKSVPDAFRTVIRQEGIAGLYKGCMPNYLKVAPAISVSFVSYEYAKQLLQPL